MGFLRQLSRSLLLVGYSWSAYSFTTTHHPGGLLFRNRPSTFLAMSSTTTTTPSWTDLIEQAASTPVGKALNTEVSLRKEGKGSASRENTLRTFGREGEPVVTLYR